MDQGIIKSYSHAVLTADEIRIVEEHAVKDGTSFACLMENAGHAVYRYITEHYQPRPTLVLCGPGNNGGDGYVVARLLRENKWPVKVATQSETAPMSDYASANRDMWKGETLPLNDKALDGIEIVIDGLFGTGLIRPVTGGYAQIVEAMNQSNKLCIAIDIPSGIHTDTGQVMGCAVQAQATVTFSYPKPGHFLMPGRVFTGQLEKVDIGLDKVARQNIQQLVNVPELWLPYLPVPQLSDHKYRRGNLLIAAGTEMTGAARLAASAARRAGAGMVTLACAPESSMIYALSAPGLLIATIDKQHSFKSRLLEKSRSCVLIGPGNGVTLATRQAVLATLSLELPCVLDADALTVFQGYPEELFQAIKGPCVLTPHAREFSRLFAITGDKMTDARVAAQRSGAIIVLKGADTLVVSPAGDIIFQTNATTDLATAGSGDVLAGIIAGLMAQNIAPLIAACIANWIHGQASQQIGLGLIAEDIVEMIAPIRKNLGHYKRTIV